MGEPARGAATPTPTEGRSSVSTEQRETLDAILRQSAFPAGSDVSEQRRLLRELISAQPLPAERDRDRSRTGRRPGRRDHRRRNRTSPCRPVLPRRRVRAGGRLPGRRPGRAGRPADPRQGHLRRLPARPRAPVPGRGRRRPGRLPSPPATTAPPRRTSPSRASPPAAASPSPPWSTPAITGCPCPPRPSSCHRMPTSPWPGRPWTPSATADPLLSRETLQARVPDYTAGQDAALGLISPVFADLSGLPPLIIQAGTHEVLLDDAVRLARQAATADVAGHPRHHPRGAARLPGLLPDPRRSGRRAGPSRTAPVGASRQRRTRHRIAKGRTRAVLTAHGPRVQIPPRDQEVAGQRPDRRERPPGLPSPGPSAYPGIVNDRSST